MLNTLAIYFLCKKNTHEKHVKAKFLISFIFFCDDNVINTLLSYKIYSRKSSFLNITFAQLLLISYVNSCVSSVRKRFSWSPKILSNFRAPFKSLWEK